MGLVPTHRRRVGTRGGTTKGPGSTKAVRPAGRREKEIDVETAVVAYEPVSIPLWRRILIIGALVMGIVAFSGARPVQASHEAIVLKVTVLKKLPVEIKLEGVKLLTTEVSALLKQVTDFLLAKEAALVAELISVIEVLEGVLYKVLDFLKSIGKLTVHTVITVKENVFGKCITVEWNKDPRVCLFVDP